MAAELLIKVLKSLIGFLIASAGTVLFGTLAYTVGSLVYNLFLHPLRSYPGPLLWRSSRLPYDYYDWKGTLTFKIRDLHIKYGDVVRVNPNDLSFASEQAIHDIFAHKAGREEFPKEPTRKANPPSGIPNILFADRETHSRYRRLLAHAFSEKGMLDQEPLIKQYVDLLINRLGEKAQSGEATDMVLWYHLCTFDLIGDLAFGEPFNCLQERKAHPWIPFIFTSIRYGIQLNAMTNWAPMVVAHYFLPEVVRTAYKENEGYVQDKVNRRIECDIERRDFWDRIISRSSDDNKRGKGMSKGEMMSNAAVFVIGGSETTATVLSGATYLLLKHPDVLKKVTAEVRSSFSDSSEMSVLSVSRLEYMLAVLDETQRIYPAIPQPSTRTPPKGGGMVYGKWVPEGTGTCVHLLGAFHMEANFHRPDEFIPERWLGEAKRAGEFANDKRAVFQPFSVGTRNCIGRNLAYAEMRLILAKVLYHFDLELNDSDRTGDWLDQKSWALWQKNPLYVRLTGASC